MTRAARHIIDKKVGTNTGGLLVRRLEGQTRKRLQRRAKHEARSLFNLEGIRTLKMVWGYSSAGRAPALQAGGRRFDPDYLHQKPLELRGKPAKCLPRKRRHDGMSELWCLRRSERYEVHVDDGPVAQLARAYD